MTAHEHHEDDIKAKIDILKKSINRREIWVHLLEDEPKTNMESYSHHKEMIEKEKQELAAIKKVHPEEFV